MNVKNNCKLTEIQKTNAGTIAVIAPDHQDWPWRRGAAATSMPAGIETMNMDSKGVIKVNVETGKPVMSVSTNIGALVSCQEVLLDGIQKVDTLQHSDLETCSSE
jgi:hypothetical protein